MMPAMVHNWCGASGAPIPDAFPMALLQLDPKGRTGLRERSDTEPKTDEKNERLILCRACRHPITSASCGTEVNGSHRHTFPNPVGIVFQISCFTMAAGCIRRGRPTGEFSWFPGFAWCYALCAKCYSHLGWHYTSGSDKSFYGLITDQLLARC